MESVSCNISCPAGIEMAQPPASSYICTYESGRFSPQPVPQCQYGANNLNI
jgi:hypothetical protein